MTAASELVSLIAKIDRVLDMPVGLLGIQGREQQRLVLLEIRRYMAAQVLESLGSEYPQAIAQAVVAGMVERWEDWLAPLKTELLVLEGQRQALLEEIEQLQQQQQALASLSSLSLIPEPEPALGEPDISPQGSEENPTELGDGDRADSPAALETPAPIDSLADLGQENWGNAEISSKIWYLGIGFAAAGLAAALLNGETGRVYPLYRRSPQTASEVNFSLPVAAYAEESEEPILVGEAALMAAESGCGLFLSNFRAVLHWAVPYWDSQQWQPRFPAINEPVISLQWVRQAIAQILAALQPENWLSLSGMAVGLTPTSLAAALGELQGIIVDCPADWGDPYRFNLREAILQAGLIPQADRIYFATPLAAVLLQHLDGVNAPKLAPVSTIILYLGVETTELSLINLGDRVPDPNNWHQGSLSYGARALEQDIFATLIYPQWRSHYPEAFAEVVGELPESAQSDPTQRQRLDWRWQQSYQLNDSCAEAITQVKAMRSQQQVVAGEWQGHPWQVAYEALEEQILGPFWQRLDLKLQELVAAPRQIAQIVIAGDSLLAKGGSLAARLAQKFPQATLADLTSELPGVQLAKGLARLPLLPAFLDRDRHQYSDYFLLTELLQALPPYPFGQGEIFQRLRRQGINTRVCQERLLALLEGKLPPLFAPVALTAEADAPELPPFLSLIDNNRYQAHLETCQRLHQQLETIAVQSQQRLKEPLLLEKTLLARPNKLTDP